MVLLLSSCARPHEFAGTALQPPTPAHDIAGINWDGRPFHLRDLQGKVVLLFFGYTSCPDICPLTLAEMKDLYTQLGPRAAEVEVVMVSVDPARDTVEQLAQYIPAFEPSFYGVHVEPALLETVKEAYGIYSETEMDSHTTAGHQVGHSSYTLVIDKRGQWRVVYPFEVTAEEMAPDIVALLEE